MPLSCDLGQAVTQLAFLRCYEGVVELPLRKAAALDPENTARLPGDRGRAGREASDNSSVTRDLFAVLTRCHNICHNTLNLQMAAAISLKVL